MPAADPIRWQLIDAIVVLFAAMDTETDDNYFYAPQEVSTIVPPLMQYLDSRSASLTTVYGVWVEDEDTLERAAGRYDNELRLFIETATRYEPTLTDPFRQREDDTTPEEEIRSKQVHDVKKVVHSQMTVQGGTQLGGLYENWEILGNDAFQSSSVRLPGWVSTQFETLIQYNHNPIDPTIQGNC